jgi:hypothetical protein
MTRYHATPEGNIPFTPAEEAEWDAIAAEAAATAGARAAKTEITALEATITQRRLREAALTQEGKDWLAGVDAQIATLRTQL